MNAAFNFPLAISQVPISAFGGGVIAMPRQDLILSAMAIDPSGRPTSNDLGKAFDFAVNHSHRSPFAGAGRHLSLSRPFKGAILASNLLGIWRISV